MSSGVDVDSSVISCSYCWQPAEVIGDTWVHIGADNDHSCPGPDAWPRPVSADGPGSKPFQLGTRAAVAANPPAPQGGNP